jgi:type I restriction enzyme M protein
MGGVSMLQQADVSPNQLPLFASTKAMLRKIRNYLAGQVLGFTRDESLLEEIVKCAFCRVTLERQGAAIPYMSTISSDVVASQYKATFQTIKQKFPALFAKDDAILLEDSYIAYMDHELASIDILGETNDLIGDIYETFVGTALRGQEGQFFTPKIAVRALVQLTDPQPDDVIIDPTCGSGSFLLEAIRHIGSHSEGSSERIHGIDKDSYLVRLAQLHLALQYDTLFPISCADSLLWGDDGFTSSSTYSLQGQYSLILTNPPFGSKIVALSGNARHKFDLAHKWRYSKSSKRYERQQELANNPAPQILFIERCISLLKDGGRMGLIIPESILSNPNHRYVVQYILQYTTPIAVIGMPESLFKTSGRGGTHTKVCLLVLQKGISPQKHHIFMAEAKWCGHDSRAREIPKDDLPAILKKFFAFKSGQAISPDKFGFLVSLEKVMDNILAPHFYDPDPVGAMEILEDTHTFYKVADLVRDKLLSISTGDEVGKLAYGEGQIPFVRTSDISSWEIKVDPKHLIDEETYQKYAAKQDVREDDILMVRDGTYLIGTCAFVTEYDTAMVYQSHIYKIRVKQGAPFDSYLLLAILSSPPVVAQIKSMSFTQDIINTLGERVYDLVLPVPKSAERCKEVSDMVRQVIRDRVEARELARRARIAVVEP